MTHDAVPAITTEPDPPIVHVQHITGRLVPDTRGTCYCGNVTDRGHGADVMPRPFTCDEVLAIRARVGR